MCVRVGVCVICIFVCVYVCIRAYVCNMHMICIYTVMQSSVCHIHENTPENLPTSPVVTKGGACVCLFSVFVCMCGFVCMCVCVKERERVCVCETECACVCMCGVCGVCVCVRVCVRVCVCESVCVCVYVGVCVCSVFRNVDAPVSVCVCGCVWGFFKVCTGMSTRAKHDRGAIGNELGSLSLKQNIVTCIGLFYRALLQKRPIILRSLLIEATP